MLRRASGQLMGRVVALAGGQGGGGGAAKSGAIGGAAAATAAPLRPAAALLPFPPAPAAAAPRPPARGFASWARQAGFRSVQPRGRADVDPETALYGLMAVNVGVFAAWRAADARPRLRAWMAANTVVSPASLAGGRPWTLVTSAFSHRDAGHLLVNLITLYFFGGAVGRAYGGRRLVGLYLAAGAAGGAAHAGAGAVECARRHPSGGRPRSACIATSRGALGASGAVNGVLALSILANPRATILVYGILPVPAFLLGGLYVLNDLRGAAGGGGGGWSPGGRSVAHWGHLGGAAVGAGVWAWKVRRGRW